MGHHRPEIRNYSIDTALGYGMAQRSDNDGKTKSPLNPSSYNKIAQAWTTVRNASFVSQLVIDFSDKVNPAGQILDAGCGSGYLSKYLAERDFQVTGVDASAKMIELARSLKLPNADFITADFFEFVSRKKFDGMIAWDSFFHFPKSMQAGIYAKAASLLHKNAYLLFTHGYLDDEHIDQMMGESFYYAALAKEKVLGILDRTGFQIEYAYTDYTEQNTHHSLVVLAKKVQ